MATTEKIRNRYQLDLDDLQNESERINSQVAVAEKKLETFDRVSPLCNKIDDTIPRMSKPNLLSRKSSEIQFAFSIEIS